MEHFASQPGAVPCYQATPRTAFVSSDPWHPDRCPRTLWQPWEAMCSGHRSPGLGVSPAPSFSYTLSSPAQCLTFSSLTPQFSHCTASPTAPFCVPTSSPFPLPSLPPNCKPQGWNPFAIPQMSGELKARQIFPRSKLHRPQKAELAV